MTPEELGAYAECAALVADVEGDIVECGVYMGESLQTLAMTLPGRRVWAFDSFQGFPPGNPEHDDPVALGLVGAVQGDPEVVAKRVWPWAGELIIRSGWFKDTFREEPLPERIAFLSIDCDLYDSVLASLNVFAHRVVPGGVVTLDDYTTFPGCRKAFEQWAKALGRRPRVTTFGPARAGWFRL
jgi:O-methyltransferase